MRGITLIEKDFRYDKKYRNIFHSGSVFVVRIKRTSQGHTGK